MSFPDMHDDTEAMFLMRKLRAAFIDAWAETRKAGDWSSTDEAVWLRVENWMRIRQVACEKSSAKMSTAEAQERYSEERKDSLVGMMERQKEKAFADERRNAIRAVMDEMVYDQSPDPINYRD